MGQRGRGKRGGRRSFPEPLPPVAALIVERQWYFHGWLRWFSAVAVSLSVVGIMDGMDVFCALVVDSGCGICCSGFAGIAPRAVFVVVRPLMLIIMAGMNQKGQLCCEMVVVIPVVTQRLITMVLSTMVIPQLQFLDKVIDDPVVRVVQVFPSRSHARCVQRQVPWLRSAVAVHRQGRLHPCRGAEFDPHGFSVLQTIEIPLLPCTWWSMSLLRWSREFHRCCC